MASPYNAVSRDAQEFLTEFSDEFRTALEVVVPDAWARLLGRYKQSSAIKTTYPIPVSAAGYKLREGGDQLRRLYERSMSMTTKEWYDGVSEKLRTLQAPDFIDWNGEPARIASEAQRFPNQLVALLLEANPLLDFYRVKHDGGDEASTINLFSASHPFNVFGEVSGVFDNDLAAAGTGLDAATLSQMKQHFRSKVKGPNGQSMGLRLTHIIAPPELEEEIKDFLDNDLLIQAVTNVAGTENVGAGVIKNRHYNTVQLVVADELTSSDYIYGIANGGTQVPAWIVQEGQSEEIRYDEASDRYKDTGHVGVKYTMEMAAAGCLPHGIVRVDVS